MDNFTYSQLNQPARDKAIHDARESLKFSASDAEIEEVLKDSQVRFNEYGELI